MKFSSILFLQMQCPKSNVMLVILYSIRCDLYNHLCVFSFLQVEHPMGEESRSEGTVAFSLYVKYYRAGANGFMLLVLVLLNLLAHVSGCYR